MIRNDYKHLRSKGETMPFLKAITGASVAVVLSASGALAWGDMYMGDSTNNPNSDMLIYAYPGENNCPAGLQPITVGGVVCCGSPNTTGTYYNRASAPKKRVYQSHAPRAYAPAGQKGVIYR